MNRQLAPPGIIAARPVRLARSPGFRGGYYKQTVIMIYIPAWKKIAILLVCLFGFLTAVPNLLPEGSLDDLPGFVPSDQLNLGLDLQGGAHLLLGVETEVVVKERMEDFVGLLRAGLVKAGVGYRNLGEDGGSAGFTLRDQAEAEKALEVAKEIARENSPAATSLLGGGSGRVDVSQDGERITLRPDEALLATWRDNTVNQAVDTVRRRVDATGTKEPNIQRQGEDRIIVQLPGLEDPEQIKSILNQVAHLTFQFVAKDSVPVPGPAKPTAHPGVESVWLPSEEELPSGGPARWYLVERRVMVGGENLVDSQPSFQDGSPVVSFRFDSVGGKRFADATKRNIGRPFAIVLDDKVVSAPTIQSAILGGSGIITGRFTTEETNNLALVLRSGALPAPMHILEERTVGPGLGQDSIAAGKLASVVGLVLVIVFMLAAYGLFGFFSVTALGVNLVLLMGLLSTLQATLTLPGIAGIVLTIGMAVDANVLIFERIREEKRLGRPAVSAIDAGYRHALDTIIDSNLTTLIAAVLLFFFGSGPIRGFSVTLTFGIITSVFSAVFLTRLMVVTWLRAKPKRDSIPI